MRLITFSPLLLLPTALRAQSLELTEWTVPWPDTRPRDPAVAPDGRVWFVGQAGNYIAVLDPGTGQFMRYEIDPGTHPHNLIVAKDGMVWYSGNQNGMIGKLNPADGAITRYPLPDKTWATRIPWSSTPRETSGSRCRQGMRSGNSRTSRRQIPDRSDAGLGLQALWNRDRLEGPPLVRRVRRQPDRDRRPRQLQAQPSTPSPILRLVPGGS